MPEAHARVLGGSSFKRISTCVPSWRLSQGIVAPEHDAATRGTALHSVAELLADDTDLDIQAFVGATVGGYEITQDDVGRDLAAVVAAMRRLRAEGPMEYEIEPNVKSDLPEYEGCSGWIDIIAYHAKTRTVTVLDWKFGRMDVSPVELPQGLFYAAMGQIDPDVGDLFADAQHVRIVIVQPNGTGDVWQEWTCPISRLEEVRATIRTVRLMALQEDGGDLTKGEHCHFCPKKPTCKAWTEIAMALPFDKEVADLQGAELARLLTLADSVDGWVGALKKHAESELNRGIDIPGYKLVQKTARRKWVSEDAAEQLLRAKAVRVRDMMQSGLKSPAQIEKVVGKKLYKIIDDAVVAKVSSGITIAPESDKRPDVRLAKALEKAVGII